MSVQNPDEFVYSWIHDRLTLDRTKEHTFTGCYQAWVQITKNLKLRKLRTNKRKSTMSYFHSFFESLRFHTRNTWKCIKIEWRIRNKLKRSWPVTNATNLWTVWSCCGDSPWRHSQSCQDRPSSTSILSQQDLCDAWRGEKNKREDYDVTCKRPGCQALFKMATSVVELLAYLKTMTESQVTRWVLGTR